MSRIINEQNNNIATIKIYFFLFLFFSFLLFYNYLNIRASIFYTVQLGGVTMDNLKKLMVLLMVVLMPTAFGKSVILVSDNFADGLAAEVVQSIFNDTEIVRAPWGEYNESIVNQIMEISPENIIIIGGPVAVPVEYEEALNESNVSIERLYGPTRYETNKRILERFKEQLKNRKIVIVYGEDGEITVENNVTVVLSNGTNITIDEDELEELNTSEVVIVENPMLNKNLIMNRFKNRGFNVSTKAMPQEVLKKIVEKRLDRLESKVQRLKGLPISAQEETSIAELEQNLEEIQTLIDNGEYQEAYKLEIITERMILNKIRVKAEAHRGKGKVIKNEIKNKIKNKVKEKVKKRIKNDSDADNDDDNAPASVDISSDTTVNISSNSTTVSTSTNITVNNVNTSVTSE
ncbi:MAG: hypothetical protein PWP15_1044 [Methanothermococcus sp.]|jgi:putative cell wall-binding protein|nr:hypothetical protein [Methanothermococcus sp.]MDK2987252.1 hypothetical protein [Methanothermococcus sp.]